MLLPKPGSDHDPPASAYSIAEIISMCLMPGLLDEVESY
jgi:hypothetical protein